MNSQLIEMLNPRFRRIATAFMSVMVENREESGNRRFTLYSGFVVEIEGAWIWITADHVFDPAHGALDITEGDDKFIVTLNPLMNDPKDRLIYAYRKKNRIRLTEAASAAAMNLGSPSVENRRLRRIAKHFDIGALFLDNYYVQHLKYVGLQPLSGSEIFAESEEEMNDLLQNSPSLCLAGIPTNSIDRTETGINSSFKILFVQPLRAYSPPLMKFLPDYAKVDHDGSLEGFSGSPIFVTDGQQTILVAVQYAQQKRKGALRINAIDARPLFLMIRSVITSPEFIEAQKQAITEFSRAQATKHLPLPCQD